MVVLISAVSMLGYVLMRFLGARQGVAVTGLLGGLASSTAATLGFSQEARQAEASLARYFALGITVACTVMFFRVLFLTLVIDPDLGRSLALPIAFPALAGVGAGIFLWMRREGQREVRLAVKNLMELGKAIQFAFLFAVVVFVSKAAHFYFGSAGVYVASALAGLTDVDAITISAAQLAHEKVLASGTANASILLASAMNTLVKGGIAVVAGGRGLRPVVTPVFLLLFLLSLAATIVVARS